MAVTGPFQVISIGQGNLTYRRRYWFRQTKPRKLRLTYLMENHTLVRVTGDPPPLISYQAAYFSSNAANNAYQAAFTKFSEEVAKKAELAVSLAERKQALEMIVTRVGQLSRFTQAVRKGRFGDAAAELGISLTHKFSPAQERLWSRRQDKMFKWARYPLRRPPKNAPPAPSKAKSVSNNYLEFHFGWSPLISDIYQACKILQDGVPPSTVRGRGSSNDATRVDYPPTVYQSASVEMRCQILADCRIVSPNAHLLAQLGLTNPLAVLWEVVPFSFVVDWFTNLGQFLTAWVGFPGITLENGAVTYFSKWTSHLQIKNTFPYNYTAQWQSVRVERVSIGGSIPTPKFVVKPFNGFSPRRGAAAVALLVQQMRSLR